MATIVVLEDDQRVRELMVQILQIQDHNVLAFDDALPALDRVDFETVDLVFTDYLMPTRGDLFVQAIRTQGYTMPIIMVSGAVSPLQARYLRSMGVNDILHKPFLLTEVLAVIEEHLCASSPICPKS